MLAGLTKAALQAPQKHRAKRDGCLPPDDYHGYPDGDNEYDLCEGCLGLSQSISSQITLNCAVQPKIAKNSIKTSILGVQDRSRSLM